MFKLTISASLRRCFLILAAEGWNVVDVRASHLYPGYLSKRFVCTNISREAILISPVTHQILLLLVFQHVICFSDT